MLGPILSALALAEVKRSADRAIRSLVIGLALAVAAGVAFAFLVAAGLIAIAQELGPVWACLIAALIFGLAALVLYVVRINVRRQRPARSAMLGALGGTAAGAASAPDGPPRRRSWRPSPRRFLLPAAAAAFVAALFAARR
ncbi:phage holin family protein [Chthonobacter albigriseus]|uniref:phage holin family protein n=1 Tax=Chthonobacter albigriseus TaxID=1683161 RepID=UPI0015EEC037|nr:phage holin family protein [Chthonobacter albigriseus]